MIKKALKYFKIIPVLSVSLLIMTSCGGGDQNTHEHHFKDNYSYDNNYHWNVCFDCEEIENKEPHTFGEWQIDTDEDYQHSGQKSRACNICDYKETETIPIKSCEHKKYGEWKIATQPSLETTGLLTRLCLDCSEQFSHLLPKLNHTDYTFKVDGILTCTTGSVDVYEYELDQQKFSFEVHNDPQGHEYEILWSFDLVNNSASVTFSCKHCDYHSEILQTNISISGSGLCTERIVKAEIEFNNKHYEETKSYEHSFSTNWETDACNHWHQCTRCDAKKDSNQHQFVNNKCEICDMDYFTEGLDFYSCSGGYGVLLKEGYHPESIIIPQKYHGKDVVSIASDAFKDCMELKTIALPNTIKDIGSYAFAGCVNLQSFIIPEQVTTIGDHVFDGCSKLETIALPKNLNYIRAFAFNQCSSLNTIEFPEYVLSIGNNAFAGSGIQTLTLPKKLEDIGNEAFMDCASLSEVAIGATTNILDESNLKTIGANAFKNCIALKNIYLSKSINKIGMDAFKGCNSLVNVYFKSNIANDWVNITFDNLEANPIYLAAHFQTWQPNIIGFAEPEEMNLVYNNTVGNIKKYAFAGLKNVKKIAIFNASIGDYAFYQVKGDIAIGNLESIGNYAFFGTDFHSVDLDMNTLNYVGDYAFADCLSLETAVVTKDTLSIFDTAFSNCPKLKSFVAAKGTMHCMPLGIEDLTIAGKEIPKDYSLEKYTFIKTVNLTTEIERISTNLKNAFPNNIEQVNYLGKIENWCNITFSDSSANPLFVFTNFKMISPEGKLEEISSDLTIPEGVVSISANAFYGARINTVTLPKSLTTIENDAFRLCTTLIEVFNLSSINITRGESANGCVGLYAKAIHNSLESSQILVEGFKFIKDNTDIYYLFDYIGNDKNLVLPDNVNGNSYYIVASNAFSNKNLTSVVIPNAVGMIEDSAFNGCNNLERMTLPFIGSNSNGTSSMNFGSIFGAPSSNDNENYVPNSLKEVIFTGGSTIETHAFDGCSNLIKVVLPSSITSIKCGAFEDCKKLESITIPFIGTSLNTVLGTNFGYIFGATSSTYNQNYVPSSLKEVTILNAPKIDISAFSNCNNITNIVLPSNITKISSGAFSHCDSLTSVYYEGTIENWCTINFISSSSNPMSIASHFYLKNNNEWQELRSIDIPNTITQIGNYQFYGFKNALSLVLPQGIVSIGENAFKDTKILEIYNYSELEIVQGSTANGYVGHCAKVIHTIEEESSLLQNDDFVFFKDSSNQYHLVSYFGSESNLILPSSINGNPYHIGESAFSNNNNLISVTIPTGVVSIESNAFANCGKLESVEMEDGVISIGDSAFQYCSNLNKVKLSKNLTVINAQTFWQCDNLTNIILPEGIEELKIFAFGYCEQLTTVELPTTLKVIGQSAFERTGLIDVILPEGLTTIGRHAFYSCDALKNVTIPNTIQEIDNEAFTSNLIYNIYDNGCYLGNNDHPYLYLVNTINQNITSCEVHDDVKLVRQSVFAYHKELTSISLPFIDRFDRGVGHLFYTSEGGFGVSSSLKEVIIRGGTKIPTDAFGTSNKIESIIILNGITTIESGAFNNCSSLLTLSIPTSVIELQQGFLFDAYTSLNYNEYDNGYYLGNEDNPYMVLVKVESKDITNCEILSNTKFIYGNAFYGCSRLKEVYYNGSFTEWSNIGLLGSNSELKSAIIFYYSEAEPAETGNYWHYIDGLPTKW